MYRVKTSRASANGTCGRPESELRRAERGNRGTETGRFGMAAATVAAVARIYLPSEKLSDLAHLGDAPPFAPARYSGFYGE